MLHAIFMAKAGIIHSVSGCMRGVQVKLQDPLRMCAIPERLRGVLQIHVYLTLPYLTSILNFYIAGIRNRDFFTCSRDLDLDPMTFIYELDPFSLEINQVCKDETPTLRFSQSYHLTDKKQTRQTRPELYTMTLH